MTGASALVGLLLATARNKLVLVNNRKGRDVGICQKF